MKNNSKIRELNTTEIEEVSGGSFYGDYMSAHDSFMDWWDGSAASPPTSEFDDDRLAP